jgi:hypothetical protein
LIARSDEVTVGVTRIVQGIIAANVEFAKKKNRSFEALRAAGSPLVGRRCDLHEKASRLHKQ